MLNTYKKEKNIIHENQQKEIITSFKKQPIIVVIRIEAENLNNFIYQENLFSLVKILNDEGLKHLEIAWSNHSNWFHLIEEMKISFPEILLGAASVNCELGLEQVGELGLKYAMTPFWNPKLQKQALDQKQLLIPGVFSPTEIYQASSLGCRIIKLFPAQTLGINYLSQLQGPFKSLPFVVAAGGLKAESISNWLDAGYGAIALGRNLVKKKVIDPKLKYWLKKYPYKIKTK